MLRNLVRCPLNLLVTLTPEPNEFIVLRNDLARRTREVDGESADLAAEIIDVEDQVLWQSLGIAPDNPAADELIWDPDLLA